MVFATHVSYGLMWSSLLSLSKVQMLYMTIGSILPDIDYPSSFIGKLLHFLSIPLNQRFGHRQSLHGFPLYGVCLLLGLCFEPLFYIALGACGHVLCDSHCVSGCKAFLPFSDIKVVAFKRQFRIYTGSPQDILLGLLFAGIFLIGLQIQHYGGVQMVLANSLQHFNIVFEEYLKQKQTVCYFNGDLRRNNGEILNGRWLVIGAEGKGKGVALWETKKQIMLHLPEQGNFSKVTLEVTSHQWRYLSVNGALPCGGFLFDQKTQRWRFISSGAAVSGRIMFRGGCDGEVVEKNGIMIDFEKMAEVLQL